MLRANRGQHLVGEGIASTVLWIIFFILAGTAAYFIIQRLIG